MTATATIAIQEEANKGYEVVTTHHTPVTMHTAQSSAHKTVGPTGPSPLRPPPLVCGLLECREKMKGRDACINVAMRMIHRASGTDLSRLRMALCTGSYLHL